MTDKEYYEKIDAAKSALDNDELFRLTKERAFDFFDRMVIKELNGYDKLPIYIAVCKLKELYTKLLSEAEIELAERTAEYIGIGGSIIAFDTDAIKKAGDSNGL